jgi:biopolymer transport protein ExbD
MGAQVGPSGGAHATINITPLVDVVLVLLIIFMVVTPMLQRGKDVQLPKATKDETPEAKADPAVVSVTFDRRAYWESNEVTLEELGGKVLDAQQRGRKVMVKGDARLSVGAIRPVLEAMQKVGAKGVGLAVQEEP